MPWSDNICTLLLSWTAAKYLKQPERFKIVLDFHLQMWIPFKNKLFKKNGMRMLTLFFKNLLNQRSLIAYLKFKIKLAHQSNSFLCELNGSWWLLLPVDLACKQCTTQCLLYLSAASSSTVAHLFPASFCSPADSGGCRGRRGLGVGKWQVTGVVAAD